jgi:putative transposase
MRWVAITGEMILMAASIEHRFGAGAMNAPHPVQWSDNGPPYAAYETCAFRESLGFPLHDAVVLARVERDCRSVRQNLKRDYVYLNKLESAHAVLGQLDTWFDDYNEVHLHRGL